MIIALFWERSANLDSAQLSFIIEGKKKVVPSSKHQCLCFLKQKASSIILKINTLDAGKYKEIYIQTYKQTLFIYVCSF